MTDSIRRLPANLSKLHELIERIKAQAGNLVVRTRLREVFGPHAATNEVVRWLLTVAEEAWREYDARHVTVVEPPAVWNDPGTGEA